jgi:hypothetical protein
MPFGGRGAALGITGLTTACLLVSCGNSPTATPKKAVRTIPTTTVPPTTTTSSSTTTTQAGVAVPNVIGLKIAAARTALRAAGFRPANFNTPCNKGTLASQSVVASLATPGKEPDPRLGATPLTPGSDATLGAQIGINWSGCYGDASDVPSVVGLSLRAARRAIHAVGLNWACFSVGKSAPTTGTSDSSTTTTTTPLTTTTVKVVQSVLTQAPAAHTVLHPGATVTLTMHHCPQ